MIEDEIAAYVAGPVGSVAHLMALQAQSAPERIAVIDDHRSIT